eukprot:10475949-Alexandrium_andersonii.AAC.1
MVRVRPPLQLRAPLPGVLVCGERPWVIVCSSVAGCILSVSGCASLHCKRGLTDANLSQNPGV